MPIVTVNLWYDRIVMDEAFVGLTGRTVQWVFDKRLAFGSDASHLSLVASGAEELVGQLETLRMELSGFLGERFLTTKREKGTGIGLLLAKTAIERAGGHLKLENRPDGGACADIVVPIGEGAQAGPEAEPEAARDMRTPALAVRYFHSQPGKV